MLKQKLLNSYPKALRTITSLFVVAFISNAYAEPFTSYAVRFSARTHTLSTLGLFPLVYPLMDTEISSKFGNRKHPVLKMQRHHSGIDLAAAKDAPIRAISGGRVVFADPYAGYGNLIVIQHANGVTTHYGHLNSFKVKPGQKIGAGTIIGAVGSTGMVTGPHLHFELRINGVPQDPQDLIPDLTSEGQG